MGIWTSKSETKVLPHNNDKSSTPSPPGPLSSQGRGMSVSRLALNMDSSSDSDDENIGDKIRKQHSNADIIRNNSNNNHLQVSSNPPSPVPPEPEKKQMENSELKGKEMGYWYFDIGASLKNKSWKVMEINAAGRQLSGGMHTVHSKKKKQ